MSLTEIQITDRREIAKGVPFGKYGRYEAISATVKYEVDPRHPHNQRIVDLSKVHEQSDKPVQFEGNLVVILPENPPACLLIDVPNRGRRITPGLFNRVNPAVALEDPFNPGDGFLYKHGFSIAAIGWQFDVQQGMHLRVPNAKKNGEEITGDVVCQMQPGRDTHSLFFGQTLEPTYVPTGTGKLYRRKHTRAPYELVPSDQWRFGRIKDGVFQKSDQFICSEQGFAKGTVYTLVYETCGAPVVGLGLLALRDATSFLKYAPDSPFHRSEHAIAYGASQTGRVLRHFLYEGLNTDESDRRVFDALIPHIAGGQRGDFNHRFAQPGSMVVPAAGQLFPFTVEKSTDSRTGKIGGVRDRVESDVKIVSTNTSWEYWRGDAALSHVSTDGKQDVEGSEYDRFYMFSGTHHINGIMPLTKQLMVNGEEVCYPLNTISYTPLMRAVLINTKRWVLEGIEPPASRMPRADDSTLVPTEAVIEEFKQQRDFPSLPNPDEMTGLCQVDLGDQINEGICEFPAKLLANYPTLVSDVDGTLNEIAGIRLPEIEVPIGIHTGWNPRLAKHGAPEQTATFAGFSWYSNALENLPPRSAVKRKVEQVTDQLIADRYVLEEDRDLVIENAMTRYDLAATIQTAK